MAEYSEGPIAKQYSTESGGSLTFKYAKQNVVVNTIGHVMAIPTHLLLGTPRDIFKDPDPAIIDALYERYKDVPWKGDVLVRVGHLSITEDFKRLFGKDIKGRPNAFFRLLGVPLILTGGIVTTLGRMDHYNPLTHTVTIFHPELPIGLHELGHAEFFDRSNRKDVWSAMTLVSAYLSGYRAIQSSLGGLDTRSRLHRQVENIVTRRPGYRLFTEWKASQNAMKHMETNAERKKALHLLEPAFGTYVGSEVGGIAQILAPDRWDVGLISEYLAPIIGLIGGHILTRLPIERRSGFGYIFEGKEQTKIN